MPEIDQKETLARVDERTSSIQRDITQLREDVKNALSALATTIKDTEHRQEQRSDELEEQLKEHKKEIERFEEKINKELEDKYVTQSDFNPIRRFVYGLISIVLTAVLTAGVSLIVVKSSGPAPARTLEVPLHHETP